MKDSTTVRIAISLTVDQLENGNTKTGLTSRYLKDIYDQEKDFITKKITNKIFINHSSFIQPQEDKAPMIMVGPGTGVVPYIGFMEEREVRLQRDQSLTLGEAYLFFGCRKSTSDFIYKDQIKYFEEKKIVDKVFYAFSREHSHKKVYV